MDNIWSYVWWGKKYISPRQIQIMKKNMRKVPIIKEKADKYHLNELNEAEEIFEKKINSKDIDEEINKKQVIIEQNTKKTNLWQKIINWLKDKLWV